MGRLRARLAASEADRELHTHLAEALRCLGKAAHSCGNVIHTNRNRGIEARRARDAQVSIRRALSLISGIGYLTPRIDHNDPDMMSEEQLAEIALAARQAREESVPGEAVQQDNESHEGFVD